MNNVQTKTSVYEVIVLKHVALIHVELMLNVCRNVIGRIAHVLQITKEIPRLNVQYLETIDQSANATMTKTVLWIEHVRTKNASILVV
jgi:hypothetical protein